MTAASQAGRHGVIALLADECTSCMLCVRECPVWCIDLTARQEPDPASPPGGRQRMINVLESFSIDYGLCMYCGICVDVCPFDALEWRSTDDYVADSRTGLVHDRDRLERWAHE